MTTAEELIANAKALLLDFDGPVTALMPPPLNAQAADAARVPLDGIDLPVEILSTTDHLTVLRWTFQHAVGRLVAVEKACTTAEVECARASEPSPEIEWLLARALETSIPAAIVSNNSEAAVRAFLARFQWAKGIDAFSCRTPATVSLMKPDPHMVIEAAKLVGVPAGDCVLVGDSVSDVQAGTTAGLRVVGLAKTRAREVELRAAGATALLYRDGDS